VTAPLPPHGTAPHEVLERLEHLRRDDVAWREGRAFSLAYLADDDTTALAAEAYRRFAGENALNTEAFPSLRRMQAEVVDAVLQACHALTEAHRLGIVHRDLSILLAVKAARDQHAQQRGISRPNVVLPASAHAAFNKACHYFGVEARRVPVRDDWRADPAAMEAACDGDTVLVVASAPQYPQGVVDDITPLAARAAELRINCHVDACMGGVTLSYLRMLGEKVAPWNFEVEGVTSVSIDLHKYGYTSKGAGVLLHRNKFLRADQTFITDNWLGGTYGSSGILGTKSGGPIAAAWAVLHHLGDDGYMRLTRAARDTALRIASHIEAHPALVLRARPDTTLLSFGVADELRHDVFAVADGLNARGWYVDRQAPPKSVHLTVNAVHELVVDEFLSDLDTVVSGTTGLEGGSGSYATVD